jgi:hypothetical protein
MPTEEYVLISQQNEWVLEDQPTEKLDQQATDLFVSRVANRVISKISGVPLHDYGCTLKAFRVEMIQGVRLYGEMHRFIPVYADSVGAKSRPLRSK